MKRIVCSTQDFSDVSCSGSCDAFIVRFELTKQIFSLWGSPIWAVLFA